MLLCFAVISTPWVVRNSLLAGEFVPFGTQGGVNFAFNYSELILGESAGINDGVSLPEELKSQYSVLYPAADSLTGDVGESSYSRFAASVGKVWLKNNPDQVPRLVWTKLTSLWWRDLSVFSGILVVLSILGLFSNLRFLSVIILPCLGVSALVAAMHNVSGERFALLMFPSLWILAGGGLSRVLELLFSPARWRKIAAIRPRV